MSEKVTKQGHGAPGTSTIAEKLLEKLCFAAEGKVSPAAYKSLRKRMVAHLRFRGDSIVTPQAIGKWCAQETRPAKLNGYTFLEDFLSRHVGSGELSDAQKKVLRQLSTYLSREIERLSGAAHNRSAQKSGRDTIGHMPLARNQNFLIQTKSNPKDLDDLAKSWVGTYISYRMRLVKSAEKPISREVIRLTRVRHMIAYEHWHLEGGTNVEKFSGFATIESQSVWLFASTQDRSRYRVCHFPRAIERGLLHRKLRWGIMQSDISLSAYREPSATRILAVLHESNENIDALIRSRVGYISEGKLPPQHRDVILRAIDNLAPAASRDSNLNPVSEADAFLRVDERTLEAMQNKYASPDS